MRARKKREQTYLADDKGFRNASACLNGVPWQADKIYLSRAVLG